MPKNLKRHSGNRAKSKQASSSTVYALRSKSHLFQALAAAAEEAETFLPCPVYEALYVLSPEAKLEPSAKRPRNLEADTDSDFDLNDNYPDTGSFETETASAREEDTSPTNLSIASASNLAPQAFAAAPRPLSFGDVYCAAPLTNHALHAALISRHKPSSPMIEADYAALFGLQEKPLFPIMDVFSVPIAPSRMLPTATQIGIFSAARPIALSISSAFKSSAEENNFDNMKGVFLSS